MSQIHNYPKWNESDLDRWRENNIVQQLQWDEFIKAMNSSEVVEMDEEMWMYWLEVLPPIYMNRRVEVAGKPRRAFGFAEGTDFITAFWREGEFPVRFFCCRTAEMNCG